MSPATTGGEHLRTSRSFSVSLRASGVAIPSLDSFARIDLELPGLLLIEALAAESDRPVAAVVDDIVERTSGDADAAWSLVEDLRARGLLIGATTDEPQQPAARPAPVQHHAFEANGSLAIETPVTFRLTEAGFRLFDHDGRLRVQLTGIELLAASDFRRPVTEADAHAAHRSSAGTQALTAAEFHQLVTRLGACDVLQSYDPDDGSRVPASERSSRVLANAIRARHQLLQAIRTGLDIHDGAAAAHDLETGRRRQRVVPVTFNGNIPPLALGLIMAYAKAYDGGRLDEHYDFRPDWVDEPSRYVAEAAHGPAVYLFSNYVWSHTDCLGVSLDVKQVSPDSVTIHGGPNTPKYEHDVEAYFRAHPHVDVTVRGEGEATTAEVLDALVGAIGDGPADLSNLHDVRGLSFRDGDKIVHTPDRERIADLDSIPSPFLTGLFDTYGGVADLSVTLESNRGCPYGCTFCDWGSATMSRIRKFSLDRVFAELEWCAKNNVLAVGLADANVGIMERDVEIAEKVAELKATYGYPTMWGANYAKNTTKYLKKIIQIMVDAEILTQGTLSLQSMDAITLSTVKRSNIKLEKYEELAVEFRRTNLPLLVELMMGLPGATVASFENDLQQCIDREIRARIPITELLVNSPMNDPEYKRENAIASEPVGTGNRSLVVSTASYSRQEYEEMKLLRREFYLCENFGVLRQVARYVRQETGGREIDFYERLRAEARDGSERWPTISFTLRALPDLMVAPVSWRWFIDEMHDYLVEVVGITDDDALRTVLDVQHALLPARERVFPLDLELPHDYAAWFRAMLVAKDDGHRSDWHELVPRLRDLPPGRFRVDDPQEICTNGIGHHIEYEVGDSWELASPVSRAVMHSIGGSAEGTVSRAGAR